MWFDAFLDKLNERESEQSAAWAVLKRPSTRFFSSAGFTMLEMTVVITVMGVLLAYGAPMFQKAFEQSRVDLASANLESVWTAQRLYWAQNKIFADEISTLETAGLLDPGFLSDLSKPSAPFLYSVTLVDEYSFLVVATRTNSTRWSGQITINQQGILAGSITGTDGSLITPMSI